MHGHCPPVDGNNYQLMPLQKRQKFRILGLSVSAVLPFREMNNGKIRGQALAGLDKIVG
jgi:hypothetical protein